MASTLDACCHEPDKQEQVLEILWADKDCQFLEIHLQECTTQGIEFDFSHFRDTIF